MAQEFHDFDIAEMLSSDEVIGVFLAEATATNDAKLIASARDTVARAKGMTLSPESRGRVEDRGASDRP